MIVGMDLDFLKKEPAVESTPVETVPAYISSVDYTGSDEDTDAALDVTVATLNGENLTNRILQFYYNLEVTNFISANYSNLSALGLDYTQPLHVYLPHFND